MAAVGRHADRQVRDQPHRHGAAGHALRLRQRQVGQPLQEREEGDVALGLRGEAQHRLAMRVVHVR